VQLVRRVQQVLAVQLVHGVQVAKREKGVLLVNLASRVVRVVQDIPAVMDDQVQQDFLDRTDLLGEVENVVQLALLVQLAPQGKQAHRDKEVHLETLDRKVVRASRENVDHREVPA